MGGGFREGCILDANVEICRYRSIRAEDLVTVLERESGEAVEGLGNAWRHLSSRPRKYC